MDPNQIEMMFLGDSIVAGYPTRSGFRGKIARALKGRPVSFVGPFEDEDGLRHAGFVGHTIASMREHLPALLSYRPDVLVVSAGGNGLPDTPASVIGEDMRKLVLAFLERGTRVIYASLIPDVRNFGAAIAAYNAAIRASVEGLPRTKIIDMGRAAGPATVESPLFSDDAHPSDLGYEAMADEFLWDAFHFRAPKEALAAVGAEEDLITPARKALDEVYPFLHPKIALYALALGLLSRYGRRAPWTYRGVPSHNWGMVQFSKSKHAGSFKFLDEGPSYAKFATPEEGATALIETWATPDVRRACVEGGAYDVASAMNEPPLFAKALEESARAVAKKFPEYQTMLNDPKKTPSAATGAEATKPADALSAEPSGRPFSLWNVGVLAVAGGIFAGTLLMNHKRAL